MCSLKCVYRGRVVVFMAGNGFERTQLCLMSEILGSLVLDGRCWLTLWCRSCLGSWSLNGGRRCGG